MKNWLLVCVLLFSPNLARADVSLFVLEAVGVAGEYTGSGHTAIHLSNICSDGAVSLRMCGEGEKGVVISSYPSFVAGENYEWMAVPLNAYLYGVESDDEIPLYANGAIRSFLREQYRRNNLSSVVRGNEDGTMPLGDWRTMLTAAFNRDIYVINIQTTLEEDRKFLLEFNERGNEGDFNSFSRNCADFSRKMVNVYFPGAAKRDWLNDFGVTTPKAVARSVVRHAESHPERFFYVGRHTQVSGPIWRSFDNRNFTEMAFKSKKYLIPSLVFYPILVPIFSGAYYVTGRFDVHNAYQDYPNSRIAKLKSDRLNKQKHRHSGAAVRSLENRIEDAKLQFLGDDISWRTYSAAFAPIIANAISQRLFQDASEVKSFFRDIELQSEPALDTDGGLILKVSYYGEQRLLGLTRSNILDPLSDRELSVKMILAKINAELLSPAKDRSTIPEFRANWNLMRELLSDQSAYLPGIRKDRGRFLEKHPPKSVKRELQKLLITVTH